MRLPAFGSEALTIFPSKTVIFPLVMLVITRGYESPACSLRTLFRELEKADASARPARPWPMTNIKRADLIHPLGDCGWVYKSAVRNV